jgi:hypothetical protein
MALCEPCQGFDIRALLMNSAAQLPEASGLTDRNQLDDHDFRPPVPMFYAHHKCITDLRRSAEVCRLCKLFWQAWLKTLDRSDFTDEWLNKMFQGRLYIGSSSWMASRQGIPFVTLTQGLSDGRSRTLCNFEAFVRRGISQQIFNYPTLICDR